MIFWSQKLPHSRYFNMHFTKRCGKRWEASCFLLTGFPGRPRRPMGPGWPSFPCKNTNKHVKIFSYEQYDLISNQMENCCFRYFDFVPAVKIEAFWLLAILRGPYLCPKLKWRPQSAAFCDWTHLTQQELVAISHPLHWSVNQRDHGRSALLLVNHVEKVNNNSIILNVERL